MATADARQRVIHRSRVIGGKPRPARGWWRMNGFRPKRGTSNMESRQLDPSPSHPKPSCLATAAAPMAAAAAAGVCPAALHAVRLGWVAVPNSRSTITPVWSSTRCSGVLPSASATFTAPPQPPRMYLTVGVCLDTTAQCSAAEGHAGRTRVKIRLDHAWRGGTLGVNGPHPGLGCWFDRDAKSSLLPWPSTDFTRLASARKRVPSAAGRPYCAARLTAFCPPCFLVSGCAPCNSSRSTSSA